MIRTMTAWTAEADNTDVAIRDIRSQLDLENNLCKNTIGIIACHYEFIHSGMVKAVCEALPFDVVGTTSSAQAVENQSDNLMLTLMVLTSDDVDFVKAVTPSLQAEPGRIIAETWQTAAAARQDKPAMLFIFAPFMLTNSGDEYVNVLTEATGGIPCFGALAVDDTVDYSECFAIDCGAYYSDRMAMILVYGDVSPRFIVANISRDKLISKSAVVTKSLGHILMEVNERPVSEYFENLGLAKASETQYALATLPFLLDYNDGTPMVSKLIVGQTPEKYAIIAGAMPEGSTFYIATADKDDILLTTGQAIDQLLQYAPNASGLLVYSCIGRSMTLGAEQFSEVELVNQRIGGVLPFMMAFSGGEICPTQVSDEKAINRFHNDAFIACLF